MSNCIVTGHKGYIGSRLYSKLKSLGHNVLGIDLNDKDSGDVINTLNDSKYFNFKPDYIFHMACWPRIGLCLNKPVETMKNNVIAGSTVLDFARKCVSVKRVIYSSSSSVVGNGSGPTNPYALQKYTTELETKIYSDVYGVDTVSLRYFNVYSEDQDASGPYATAIAHWRHSLLNKIEPYITGDGEQRRDMVHVDDVVSANIFVMEYEDLLHGESFDVGTGENMSLNEIKDVILSYHDVEFNYVAPRPGEVMMTRANTEPLKKLGWTADITIRDGIKRCFNFGVTK